MIRADKWIELYKPNPGAKLRLFCFPYAGGAAQAFRTWPECLPPSVEVCPIQQPGRWTRLREPPFTRVAPLVRAAASALGPYLEQPFALLGHSLGAIVAFELARELRRQGGPSPLHLFVSSRRAPQIPREGPLIYHLPDAEFIERVRQTYAGIPGEVLAAPDLLELLLPTLRADMELFDTYAYSQQPPLSCPISAFGGLEDPVARRADLEAWSAQTSAAYSLEMFPGGHFFFTNPSKQPFFEALSRRLREIQVTSR